MRLFRFRICRIMVFVVLLFLCSSETHAQDYRSLEDYPFIIILRAETPVESLNMTDSLFNSISTEIQFVVNKTDLNYKADFFKMFENEVLPLLKDENVAIQQLFIRGAASPEGPYLNNQRLGRERTQVLLDYIRKATSGNGVERSFEVAASSVTEDYARLVDLMEEARDKDAQRVRDLFESCGWDELQCKTLLGQLDGGALWNRLLQTYFPRLRATRVVFVFRETGLGQDLEKLGLPEGIYAVSHGSPSGIQIPDFSSSALENAVPDYSRRHLLALRTNLLRDFFYMPRFGFAPSLDVQLEYYPLGGHYTANASFTWSNHRHWDDQKFFQIREAQLELRRYFKGGGAFTGLYAGIYGEGVVYGIGLGPDTGWEGEGWGAGLDLGYVLPINRKGNLRLEFNVSAGYIGSVYDPYVYGNPVTGSTEDGLYYYDFTGSPKDFVRRNHLLTWFGPTNLGVSLTYDILYRKPVMKGGTR